MLTISEFNEPGGTNFFKCCDIDIVPAAGLTQLISNETKSRANDDSLRAVDMNRSDSFLFLKNSSFVLVVGSSVSSRPPTSALAPVLSCISTPVASAVKASISFFNSSSDRLTNGPLS